MTSTKTARIKVFPVGQCFAVAAAVVARNNRTVHSTRDYPYGYDAQARAAAEEWARQHNYAVTDIED